VAKTEELSFPCKTSIKNNYNKLPYLKKRISHLEENQDKYSKLELAEELTKINRKVVASLNDLRTSQCPRKSKKFKEVKSLIKDQHRRLMKLTKGINEKNPS
tara:strand:- start:186 stop:491 length:306 start_codon:yes stop_codon:yes gene_type:complete